MDPHSRSFTPFSSNNDNWHVPTDLTRIQQVQAEHSERLSRLERKQEDDARMKSVWGQTSPFPGVLSGTPQQAPLHQPPADHFRTFDDETNTMISSLHLDAEDEPRRGMSANSRANSVRFDETANQNHFSHPTRPSVEYMSRTSSVLGGLQMTERTSSHKSNEGRASSQHSIRSTASGRASSLNLDTTHGASDTSRSSLDTPAIAPGLLLLGSVPAIIRCWMNTNFKHDALLYAAVCTGSYNSFLNLALVQKLGFEDNINSSAEGARMVELPVYFPEAVPHPATSRSSSPAPQLPILTVDFHVVDLDISENDKTIQIFLGSDVLRSHSADILFSSNTMTLFDDDRSKLRIPLVRPESEAAFKSLFITSGAAPTLMAKVGDDAKDDSYSNGMEVGSSAASLASPTVSPPPGKYRAPGVIAADQGAAEPTKAGATSSDSETRSTSRQSSSTRPALSSLVNTRSDARDEPSSQTSTPLRSGSSPAIWGNWRREGSASSSTPQSAGMDWASASKTRDSSYQRKDTGIKVLKPKTATRTLSSTAASSSVLSPSVAATPASDNSRSRFFDEGKRKGFDGEGHKPIGSEMKRQGSATSTNASADAGSTATTTTASQQQTLPKTKPNPIGTGSAFSWLNSGGGSTAK